jgi:hypothetical protein
MKVAIRAKGTKTPIQNPAQNLQSNRLSKLQYYF